MHNESQKENDNQNINDEDNESKEQIDIKIDNPGKDNRNNEDQGNDPNLTIANEKSTELIIDDHNVNNSDIDRPQQELEEFGLKDADELDQDTDTELTDEPVELGDNVDLLTNIQTKTKGNPKSTDVESDSELPENITLLPSKADTQMFADLYDPQMIVQKKEDAQIASFYVNVVLTDLKS